MYVSFEQHSNKVKTPMTTQNFVNGVLLIKYVDQYLELENTLI